MEVREPDWRPLEAVLAPQVCEDFMYMGHVGDLVLYKHRDTRQYLNIDAITGRFYSYVDGGYVEVERDWVLGHVQGLIREKENKDV
jgi:hypothetical protein